MSTLFSKIKEHKLIQTIMGLSREVLMIIIGILFALKIDTWVGERADKSSLQSNLNYVSEDLNYNSGALQKTKVQKAQSIHQCTDLIDHFKQQQSMNSEDIVVTLSGILKTNKFVIHQSGFERIKTSPLYESDEFFEVRDKIRQYNGVLTDLRFTENFINSYISSLSHEMSKNGLTVCV